MMREIFFFKKYFTFENKNDLSIKNIEEEEG